MIHQLKAEFRKLLSTRSTYVITFIAYLLLSAVSLYIEAYKNGASNVRLPGGSYFLADSITIHSAILAVFGAIVALLLMSQEYRFNTIIYTLASTSSRTRTLLAKLFVVIAYIFVFTVVGSLLGLGFMVVGIHLAGLSLPHQDLSFVAYLTETLAYCEGYALAGLLFATLLRNQIAAITVLLIFPTTIEPLLRLLLNDKAVYLPFVALSQVVSLPIVNAATEAQLPPGTLPPIKSGLIFLAYLATGWFVAWLLFLRRDAS